MTIDDLTDAEMAELDDAFDAYLDSFDAMVSTMVDTGMTEEMAAYAMDSAATA